jgi:hypothetical protein
MRRHTRRRLAEHAKFLAAAVAVLSSWRGDYLRIRGRDLARLRQRLRSAGAEGDEHVVFASVVTRVYPESWWSYRDVRRILVLTTGAAYELDLIGVMGTRMLRVRRRIALSVLRCVAVGAGPVGAGLDAFALMMRTGPNFELRNVEFRTGGGGSDARPAAASRSDPDPADAPRRQAAADVEWDRLYQSPRRTEIVATLMLLYEARVGRPLPLEFEASMMLTMQDGARMRTYLDETAGRIRLARINRPQSAQVAGGTNG